MIVLCIMEPPILRWDTNTGTVVGGNTESDKGNMVIYTILYIIYHMLN